MVLFAVMSDLLSFRLLVQKLEKLLSLSSGLLVIPRLSYALIRVYQMTDKLWAAHEKCTCMYKHHWYLPSTFFLRFCSCFYFLLSTMHHRLYCSLFRRIMRTSRWREAWPDSRISWSFHPMRPATSIKISDYLGTSQSLTVYIQECIYALPVDIRLMCVQAKSPLEKYSVFFQTWSTAFPERVWTLKYLHDRFCLEWCK